MVVLYPRTLSRALCSIDLFLYIFLFLKKRYERSGLAAPRVHDCAEFADHDVDRITEDVGEETTAEVNSFMVTESRFTSRQQRSVFDGM